MIKYIGLLVCLVNKWKLLILEFIEQVWNIVAITRRCILWCRLIYFHYLSNISVSFYHSDSNISRVFKWTIRFHGSIQLIYLGFWLVIIPFEWMNRQLEARIFKLKIQSWLNYLYFNNLMTAQQNDAFNEPRYFHRMSCGVHTSTNILVPVSYI